MDPVSTQEVSEVATSGLRFGALVRIALILLGVVSATLLAHSAFGFRFSEDFLLFLDIVRDAVAFIVTPFELLIVKPIVQHLQDYGVIVELREHWKSAFVLLWLYHASFTKAVAPLSDLYISSSKDVIDALESVVRWTWASLLALAGGALAGTVPLNHPAVLWWPVAAFFLTWAGNFFVDAIFDRSFPDAVRGLTVLAIPVFFILLAVGWFQLPTAVGYPAAFWWPMSAWFLFWAVGGFVAAVFDPVRSYALRGVAGLAIAVVFGLLALGFIPTPAWLSFDDLPSPGLANLATFVAAIAAWYMLLAFMFPTKGEGSHFDRWRASPPTRTAFDIFVVMGGAAILVLGARMVA